MSCCGFLVFFLIIRDKENLSIMEKKKRKRIVRRVAQVDQKENSWDYWDVSENDIYPASEVGQATRAFVQCSTKLFYETFGKESGCNNNIRCHCRSDDKSKKPFGSLYQARSTCACLWDKNEDMRPYKCRLCNKYHIGHKNGNGHSTPYKIYKTGEVAELLIDFASAMKRLFAEDDNTYPPLPTYHVRNTKG